MHEWHWNELEQKNVTGWRYREITNSSSAKTNIWGGGQSNVVNLHFVSEVSPEVVRDISISRDQLELLSLSEEETNIIFCSPFGL